MLDTQNAVQVPTVRCCSANKGMKYWYNSSMDELENVTLGEKSLTEDHTLQDCTHLRCPGQATSQTQKEDQRLLEAGAGVGVGEMGNDY